jgi:hypothetical protein
MAENTAQQIYNSEGFWLEKIERSKSIAIDIDKDLKNEKTTYTFQDGSKLIFQALAHGLPTHSEWEAFVDSQYSDPALSNAIGDSKWTEGTGFLGCSPQLLVEFCGLYLERDCSEHDVG